MDDGNISRQTLTAQLTEQVRRDILLGRIPSGSRVTVQSIADRYHVSAIPVRETMRTLSGEDLLVMLPYKGAVVRTIDSAYIEGVYDILRSMEVLIAESALEHWSESLRAELMDINAKIAALQTEEDIRRDFGELDHAFHEPLLRSSTNDRARQLRDHCHQCIQILSESYVPRSPRRVLEVSREHQSIIDALDAHDLDAFHAAYFAHTLHAKKEFMWRSTAAR